MASSRIIPDIVKKNETEILRSWLDEQTSTLTLRRDLMSESDLAEQSRRFLSLFQEAIQTGSSSFQGDEWRRVRDYLSEISASRARLGFTPTETATFIFSLKQPIFTQLRRSLQNDPESLAEELWGVTTILDSIGLFTTETYQKSREEVILRQQSEMLELSTPVVQLWDGVLALPMIGTLDSNRTQVVMETLLQKIVETGSQVAIIDITGVPTVDTLVAQYLLKTVAAARLMGADCIISGIRPQIAATIVQLGVDLGSVETKGSLAEAFRLALHKNRMTRYQNNINLLATANNTTRHNTPGATV